MSSSKIYPKSGTCQNKTVTFLKILTISGKKEIRNGKMRGFGCFITTRPRHLSFTALMAAVAETALRSILN